MTVEWIEAARAAQELLVGKKHGELERSLLYAGWKDANSARRAIAALHYLDHLKQKESTTYTALQDAPFSVVEILARWNAFDPEAASRRAIDWAASKDSVRILAEALKSARKLDKLATTKEDVSSRILQEVKAPLTAKLKKILPGQLSGPAVNFKATGSPPVDFRFELSAEDPKVSIRTIAVLLVGPYQNSILYSKRRHDWILKAFALNWFFDYVFLIVPRPDFAEQYSSWIRVCARRAADLTANRRRPEVDVVVIAKAAIPRITAEEDHAIATLKA